MAINPDSALVRFFRKLPPSTDSWTCKWFWTILLSSAVVFVIALFMLPGTSPTIAMLLTDAIAFYVLGMRRKSNSNSRGETC